MAKITIKSLGGGDDRPNGPGFVGTSGYYAVRRDGEFVAYLRQRHEDIAPPAKVIGYSVEADLHDGQAHPHPDFNGTIFPKMADARKALVQHFG